MRPSLFLKRKFHKNRTRRWYEDTHLIMFPKEICSDKRAGRRVNQTQMTEVIRAKIIINTKPQQIMAKLWSFHYYLFLFFNLILQENEEILEKNDEKSIIEKRKENSEKGQNAFTSLWTSHWKPEKCSCIHTTIEITSKQQEMERNERSSRRKADENLLHVFKCIIAKKLVQRKRMKENVGAQQQINYFINSKTTFWPWIRAKLSLLRYKATYNTGTKINKARESALKRWYDSDGLRNTWRCLFLYFSLHDESG